jgi:hypothetical protein
MDAVSAMSTRSNEIYVSYDLKWCFGHVVRSLNTGTDQQEAKITIDALAEDILMQWLKEHRPDLIKVLERRQSLEEDARKAAEPLKAK